MALSSFAVFDQQRLVDRLLAELPVADDKGEVVFFDGTFPEYESLFFRKGDVLFLALMAGLFAAIRVWV